MENNLVEMLQSGEFSDVKIIVGQGTEQMEFNSHKVVLCGLSGYFRKVLSPTSEFKEAKENVVRLPDTDTKRFKKMLEYFYTNRWLTTNDAEGAEMYAQADYFDVPSIKACVVGDIVGRISPYYPNYTLLGIKSVFEHYREEDRELVAPIMEKFVKDNCFRRHLNYEGDHFRPIFLSNPSLAVFVIDHLAK